MVWGNGAAYATWFTAIPSQIHGINFLPITGGSLYLGHSPAHIEANYDELVKNGGNENASMVWAGLDWSALALGNPAKASTLLDTYFDAYSSEEGETKAVTYHWIHSLNVLGTPDASVTASLPTAAAFIKGGVRTYTAYNPTQAALTVTFSTGKTLAVPARSMASGK